eukprot:6193396-Pleurochrysis_carterae.AAC.5
MQSTFLSALYLVRTSFVLEAWISLPSSPHGPFYAALWPLLTDQVWRRTVRAGYVVLATAYNELKRLGFPKKGGELEDKLNRKIPKKHESRMGVDIPNVEMKTKVSWAISSFPQKQG